MFTTYVVIYNSDPLFIEVHLEVVDPAVALNGIKCGTARVASSAIACQHTSIPFFTSLGALTVFLAQASRDEAKGDFDDAQQQKNREPYRP